eukprot:2783559-Prymnesium_polylepis.1
MHCSPAQQQIIAKMLLDHTADTILQVRRQTSLNYVGPPTPATTPSPSEAHYHIAAVAQYEEFGSAGGGALWCGPSLLDLERRVLIKGKVKAKKAMKEMTKKKEVRARATKLSLMRRISTKFESSFSRASISSP